MDYKNKYEQALEWMQSLYSGLHGATKEEAEHYFPELKESEDERIRKGLIEYLKADMEYNPSQNKSFYQKSIAWLERQGQKVTNINGEDYGIDANKKVDRIIGTADHIKTALDVLNKKGGEE